MGYIALNRSQDTLFSSGSPPSVTASSAFPDAKNIVVNQFSNGVSCDSSGGGSSKDSKQTTDHRSETGTDKGTDSCTRFTSGCRSNITASTGSQKCGCSSGLRYHIGFFSTYFTIHTVINLLLMTGRVNSRGAFILPKVHHFFESQVGLLVFTKVQDGDRPSRNNG